MKPGIASWIWSISGSQELAPGQTADEALGRLEPLFQEPGTQHRRTSGRLVFRKKDAAAQDKLAAFDAGVLRIENGAQRPALHYRLASRPLFLCFLAPLLFLAFAQLNIALGNHDKASHQGKEAAAAAESKKGKDPADRAMNPVDSFLGAPRAEKKSAAKKAEEKFKRRYSPAPGYAFAGIFAALYVLGRILEARLVKSLFRQRLLDP